MSDAKTMTRRRFLAAAGGAVGVSCLACSGLTALSLRIPDIDYVDDHFGKEDEMNKKILVAYASKCGSTGEIAQAIGQALSEGGASVDVRRVQDVKNLDGYRAVVLGGGARMQKLYPEAVKFANRHRKALNQVPTAYFFAGITMKEDTPENRKLAAAYLEPLRQIQQPVSEGLFGGKLDYQTLEPLFRTMLSFAKDAMPEGDWRNWEAIRAWAQSLAPVMVG